METHNQESINLDRKDEELIDPSSLSAKTRLESRLLQSSRNFQNEIKNLNTNYVLCVREDKVRLKSNVKIAEKRKEGLVESKQV